MAKPSKPAPVAEQPKTEAPKVVKKAFSVERVPGGWQFVTFTYDDQDKLVSVTRTQPDLKSIALEAFKIASFNYWTKEVNV